MGNFLPCKQTTQNCSLTILKDATIKLGHVVNFEVFFFLKVSHLLTIQVTRQGLYNFAQYSVTSLPMRIAPIIILVVFSSF